MGPRWGGGHVDLNGQSAACVHRKLGRCREGGGGEGERGNVGSVLWRKSYLAQMSQNCSSAIREGAD